MLACRVIFVRCCRTFVDHVRFGWRRLIGYPLRSGLGWSGRRLLADIGRPLIGVATVGRRAPPRFRRRFGRCSAGLSQVIAEFVGVVAPTAEDGSADVWTGRCCRKQIVDHRLMHVLDSRGHELFGGWADLFELAERYQKHVRRT